jgi:flagella basal body P-ring formation protein FlgA
MVSASFRALTGPVLLAVAAAVFAPAVPLFAASAAARPGVPGEAATGADPDSRPAEAPAGSPARPLEQVSIRFQDESSVAGERIRLGDVARVLAGSQRAVAELETLEVAKSAGFGLTRMLDTDLLFARVLKPYSDRFAFDIDHKLIRVSTRAAKLPTDSLARLIDAFVAAMPAPKGMVRRWEIARAPAEILVPETPHTLALAFAGAKRKGKVDLTLDVRDERRALRHVPITINLRVEEPVLVATQRIDRDQPLTPANTRIEMRETTQFNESVMGDPARMVGRLAKATLNPGRIITPLVVAIPPVVKRGQEAKIVYRNGAVSVTAGAVCRQDGLPGQIITAKSLASQRLVRVRVGEDGTLEPIPGG